MFCVKIDNGGPNGTRLCIKLKCGMYGTALTFVVDALGTTS